MKGKILAATIIVLLIAPVNKVYAYESNNLINPFNYKSPLSPYNPINWDDDKTVNKYTSDANDEAEKFLSYIGLPGYDDIKLKEATKDYITSNDVLSRFKDYIMSPLGLLAIGGVGPLAVMLKTKSESFFEGMVKNDFKR